MTLFQKKYVTLSSNYHHFQNITNMKKIAILFVVAMMTTTSINAQSHSDWTFNTRAWSTNYFTTLIYAIAKEGLVDLAFKSKSDSLWAERIIPTSDLVFPIGMGKKGFSHDNEPQPGGNNIYCPYHRAFSNPFKNIGDYAIGLDISYKPGALGLYGGAYYKSQEVIYKHTKDNVRGFYFQPRAGIVIGGKDDQFEAGVFYDMVTSCGGSIPGKDKDMLKSGWGLDFALVDVDKHGKTLLQFSMPLHNFFDTDYPGQQGLKRKVGYIMLTRRVAL